MLDSRVADHQGHIGQARAEELAILDAVLVGSGVENTRALRDRLIGGAVDDGSLAVPVH